MINYNMIIIITILICILLILKTKIFENFQQDKNTISNKDFHKIITKQTCIDPINKCKSLDNYSIHDLYGINKLTKKKYTPMERYEKKSQYDNICNARKHKLNTCCDPRDNKIDSMKELIPKEKHKTMPYIKKITKNGLDSYDICTEGKQKCIENGFNKPTMYDYCKLSGDYKIIDKKKITELVPDCLDAMCNDDDFDVVNSNYEKRYLSFQDFYIVNAIKSDNLNYLKRYFFDSKENVNRQLQYGYPGNTMLHESLYHNSEKCIDFLFERKPDLTLKNKDGNTVLHICCLKGDIINANKLIRFGSDLNIENNYKDKPLNSAIKSGNFEIVLLMINNGASIFEKNIRGETPLHTAILVPKKNYKIIKYLINNGSDLLTTNDQDETMLKSLEKLKKKSVKDEEIRTLIQRKIYDSLDEDKYYKIIEKYPEVAPYIIDKENDDKDTKQNSGTFSEEIYKDKIEVIYEDNTDRDRLYYSPLRKPIKIIPPNIRKSVTEKQGGI